MENNNTDISFSPTISKQIRTALFDIMQDGGVYTTSEIRTQMEKRFNLAYKRDYNINHFWGVINSLLKSDKLKRKNNGFYLVASHLQQQVLTLTETADCEHMSSINQKNTDIIEHSNSMADLYTEIVNKLVHCYEEISKSLDEHKFTAAQISAKDIQALSKIATLTKDLSTLISKIQE